MNGMFLLGGEEHITASIWGASKIAKNAHKGQVDKAGVDYFEGHIMYVYSHAPDGCAKIVALLHDVLEDTDVRMEYLKSCEFPAEVYPALDAITRREDEPYIEYIQRVKANDLATSVKIVDLQHNMDETRFSVVPNGFERLQKRYQAAIEDLTKSKESKEKKG